ncbi:MAG: DUF4010 domain-containing protein [Burkholderiaceae bacterium]|nr:DUF4010 domain-containing protein [Burkholderiaceae bacterium]
METEPLFAADPQALLQLLAALAISAGIGLLVGLERERKPTAKAGLRTFALIAVFGTLAALLAQETRSEWLLALGLVAVAAPLIAAYHADPQTRTDDSGTTTTIAALIVYCLGAAIQFGYREPAVAVGVAMTALLHFKAELEGVAQRLTPTDIRSMLQFAAVSAVILPLAPNEAFGPYGVLNPFQIWLMVVLVSGVSLAAYVAWRLSGAVGERLRGGGLLVTGLLGGLVSSTATTLVFARNARAGTHAPPVALAVILLANAAMLARVLLIAALVAPSALPPVAAALAPALALALVTVALNWRTARDGAVAGAGAYRNPTNLAAAIGFALLYALVLLVSAWLSDAVGARGVYALAFVSGLTDVDAITLSSLQLYHGGALAAAGAATAIAIAVAANLLLKAALVFVAGDAAIGWRVARAFALPLAVLAAAVPALHALA